MYATEGYAQLSARLQTQLPVICPLPAWAALCVEQQTTEAATLMTTIIEDGEKARGGEPPRGMANACGLPFNLRMPLPKPPWFWERKGFSCWADQNAPETRAYLRDYWEFQRAYRAASDAYLAGDRDAPFPPGAFKPVVHEPTRHTISASPATTATTVAARTSNP